MILSDIPMFLFAAVPAAIILAIVVWPVGRNHE